jgi:hypothetical protein
MPGLPSPPLPGLPGVSADPAISRAIDFFGNTNQVQILGNATATGDFRCTTARPRGLGDGRRRGGAAGRSFGARSGIRSMLDRSARHRPPPAPFVEIDVLPGNLTRHGYGPRGHRECLLQLRGTR